MMLTRLFRPALAPAAIALAVTLAVTLAGCRSGEESGGAAAPQATSAPLDLANTLGDAPSRFLAEQADSPVHWQGWSPDALELAARGNRMIVAIVGSTRFPGCRETLDAIDRHPALVELINANFVPVLVDLDLTRETGLFAYSLSPETGKSVSFPFLMILSPEGSPVSWHPMSYRDDDSIIEFIDNSISILVRMWDESPDYVTTNSRSSVDRRRELLVPPDPVIEDDEDRIAGLLDITRNLVNRHDPRLGTYDGAGGLLPLGIIDCLQQLSRNEAIPAPLRKRAIQTASELADSLLSSPMFDPLDGGVYPSRRGRSWDLPLLSRDCHTQARTAAVLARLHQLTGTPRQLEAARRAVHFAEATFRTSDGLFALTSMPSADPGEEWLWKTEQVAKLLDPGEFKVWSSLAGLEGLGNISTDADPTRELFRYNTLGQRRTPDQVAGETGLDPTRVEALIESGRKKLLKAREARFPAPQGSGLPSAAASFRMVTAYANLYAASGDEGLLEKATALATTARERFSDSRFLNERPGLGPEAMSDCRAFTYALAATAALDLAAVTLDDSWNLWAQDLMTLVGEHFVTGDGRLIEVRGVSKVIDLDLEDRVMVFDDSTAGLVRQVLSRLDSLGYQTPPALLHWRNSVPTDGLRVPVVFTDSIIALNHRLAGRSLRVGPDAGEGITALVRRLPILHVDRRADEEAAAQVLQVRPGNEPEALEDPAAVRALLAPIR